MWKGKAVCSMPRIICLYKDEYEKQDYKLHAHTNTHPLASSWQSSASTHLRRKLIAFCARQHSQTAVGHTTATANALEKWQPPAESISCSVFFFKTAHLSPAQFHETGITYTFITATLYVIGFSQCGKMNQPFLLLYKNGSVPHALSRGEGSFPWQHPAALYLTRIKDWRTWASCLNFSDKQSNTLVCLITKLAYCQLPEKHRIRVMPFLREAKLS